MNINDSPKVEGGGPSQVNREPDQSVGPQATDEQSPPPLNLQSRLTATSVAAAKPLVESISTHATLNSIRESYNTLLRMGEEIVFMGARIFNLDILAIAGLFLSAKTAALICGALATTLVAATMLTPIGWIYLGLRSKENRQEDLQKLVFITLWPSSQLTTFCGSCIEYAGGGTELANKVVTISQRLDKYFAALGSLATGVTVAGLAGLFTAGTAPAIACIVVGAGLGIASTKFFKELDLKFMESE